MSKTKCVRCKRRLWFDDVRPADERRKDCFVHRLFLGRNLVATRRVFWGDTFTGSSYVVHDFCKQCQEEPACV